MIDPVFKVKKKEKKKKKKFRILFFLRKILIGGNNFFLQKSNYFYLDLGVFNSGGFVNQLIKNKWPNWDKKLCAILNFVKGIHYNSLLTLFHGQIYLS